MTFVDTPSVAIQVYRRRAVRALEEAVSRGDRLSAHALRVMRSADEPESPVVLFRDDGDVDAA